MLDLLRQKTTGRNGQFVTLTMTFGFMVSIYQAATAFDLDVPQQALVKILGKTTVADLVVGDSAYINSYDLCNKGDIIFIVSNAFTEAKISYDYSMKIIRVVGNSFDMILVPPDTMTPDTTANFLLSISNRGDCQKVVDAHSDVTLFSVSRINGFQKLSTLVASLMFKP